MKYVAPSLRLKVFTCPFCHAYATMRWKNVCVEHFSGNYAQIPFAQCECLSCEQPSLWNTNIGNIVTPSVVSAPMASSDLPDECRIDFEEARQILAASPRGAAALLRLCIQKLCVVLGESGKNINDDIKSLVTKGLPVQIQQAFDYVRVTGNNAVHPGEMSLKDDPETVSIMFEMINLIVEERISRPKKLEEHYGRLPESARAAIEKRDTSK
ncbi:DUF4145 domain-containing protein [Pseudomonas aeruginosa]|uniref:DUF4145 domain-containing protein n=1 Tax=Pseudomonas aeruginosa TaxID=287 RepID=UPI0022CDFDB6|nr:DUF4145 domain-containing protein [Pseudomonas aeruginosa]MCZ9671342.1 DUF4145 domain-containing protein [Pseudomonas aeruginosa]